MTAELVGAGLLCIAMGFGHTFVGVRYVLPFMTRDRIPGSSLGPSSMTIAMIRVSWYVVTIFVLGTGGILLTLAWSDAGAQRVLLRWLAVMWVVATLMALQVTQVRRQGLRDFLRLPVPVVWVAVAVLCWAAS